MKNILYTVLFIISSLSLSGCFATSQSYSDLKSEISSLKRVINQMQENQADLVVTMQELNGSMIGLTEKLEDDKDITSNLSRKMDDMEANFNYKMDDLSMKLSGKTQKQQPSPSHIYEIAFNDYTQKHYELAAVSFRNYLERYAQGELAGKSQYYLADCMLKVKNEAEALDKFEKYIRLYPRGEYIDDAKEKYAELLKKHEGSKSEKPGAKYKKKKKEQVKEDKPPPKPEKKKAEKVKEPVRKNDAKIQISPGMKISP